MPTPAASPGLPAQPPMPQQLGVTVQGSPVASPMTGRPGVQQPAPQPTTLTLDALREYSVVSLIEIVAIAGFVGGAIFVLAEKWIFGTAEALATARSEWERTFDKRVVTIEDHKTAELEVGVNQSLIVVLRSAVEKLRG